jgi:RNA polymerase sigma factor (TIGR02999 family)
MKTSPSLDVTQLLMAWSLGEESALEKLVPAIYKELHRLAHYYMTRESPGHILQTTALVHEAYLKLVDSKQQHWQNRAHFFGISAHLMRQILVDFARAHRSPKRGGEIQKISLDESMAFPVEEDIDLITLNDALEVLAKFDKRKSQVVELRFFGGLNTEEIAAVLKVSPHTVLTDWSTAKAWLYREMSKQ